MNIPPPSPSFPKNPLLEQDLESGRDNMFQGLLDRASKEKLDTDLFSDSFLPSLSKDLSTPKGMALTGCAGLVAVPIGLAIGALDLVLGIIGVVLTPVILLLGSAALLIGGIIKGIGKLFSSATPNSPPIAASQNEERTP